MWLYEQMTASKVFWLAILGACTPTSGSSGDDTAADLAQYQALVQQLDANRTQFLPTGIRTPASVGQLLFWAEYGDNSSPPLSSYDEQSGAQVTYGFSIGDATTGDVNYRASADLVVTTDMSNVYQVYSTSKPQQLLGQFSLTPPDDEQKWWAYAVDGTTVYVLTTGSSTELLRWQPGDAAPTTLFALEDAGITVGELWDFDVAGTSAVIIESGAVWHLDLTTRRSVRIPAQNQLDPSNPISFDDAGVLYSALGGSSDDLLYYSLASGTLTDVSAAIAASSFQINSTFSQVHYYNSGGTLDRANSLGSGSAVAPNIVYIGENGMFRFDLASSKVTPILLSPDQVGLRIDYRAPSPLASGDIYVVGFTSTDGASGVDGPLYKVSAPM